MSEAAMTWQEAVPLTILCLTGPPSFALLFGTIVTGRWPWGRK